MNYRVTADGASPLVERTCRVQCIFGAPVTSKRLGCSRVKLPSITSAEKIKRVQLCAAARTQEAAEPATVMASCRVESPEWTPLSPQGMPSVSSRESIASSRNSNIQRQDSFSINVDEDPLEAASTAGDSPSRVFGIGASMQGLILLNVGAALFGSNQVVIKLAEADLSPELLNTLRFGIAALCFAPSIVRGLRNPKIWKPSVELGFWLFGGYTAQALGLMETTAARGAFTGTFTVLAVPVLVGLSGRRVGFKTWAAAAVALAGVGLLTNDAAAPNVGDAFCILSAVLFGVHKWRTESVTSEFSEDTTELIGLQLGVLALASGVASLPLLGGLAHTSPGELWDATMGLPWLALVYMGLATTAFTLWIEMHALKKVSAPLAALIYTAEPLWGALLAYLVLGERWGAMGWVGAGLIVSASLASQLGGAPVEPPKVKIEDKEEEEVAPELAERVMHPASPATCSAARPTHPKLRVSPEVKLMGLPSAPTGNLAHRMLTRRASFDGEL